MSIRKFRGYSGYESKQHPKYDYAALKEFNSIHKKWPLRKLNTGNILENYFGQRSLTHEGEFSEQFLVHGKL